MSYDSEHKSEIEKRLVLAEDRLAIFELEGAYGPTYDGKQAEAWAALFTEDGVYRGRQLEGMPEQNLVQGREDLIRFCNEQQLNGTHFMHLPHIVLDGDTATARVHHQYQGADVDGCGRVQLRSVTGYYDVLYARTSGGWRIRHRITNYLEAGRSSFYPYEETAGDFDSAGFQGISYRDRRS